ncbi:hypothetical protein ABZ135_13185 [Streptomyces sp. NPDC006339]|uniref:hypothetical protein n=1 Tax=Streptomyces sp. NPDC006339 TaxID=3156755 RepID=UPI0033A75C16
MNSRPTSTPRTASFLKAAVAVQTLSLFFQAATAGALLTSSRGYLLHDVGSKVMYGAALLYLVAAILAWRPGGGPARPVLYATGFLVLASAQVALGVAHVASLHVPLGVVMFALSTLDLARVLAPRAPARRTATGA